MNIQFKAIRHKSMTQLLLCNTQKTKQIAKKDPKQQIYREYTNPIRDYVKHTDMDQKYGYCDFTSYIWVIFIKESPENVQVPFCTPYSGFGVLFLIFINP